jgi:hypothetical protein
VLELQHGSYCHPCIVLPAAAKARLKVIALKAQCDVRDHAVIEAAANRIHQA